MKKRKILKKLISGSKNVSFSEGTICANGFQIDRINGSHHIFVHQDIPELVNLQNVKGKVKPYQIKPIIKYNLISSF